MKVIERYILRRASVLFLGALAWTLGIVWTTQVLTRIDLVTDNGQSALTFFAIATLVLPSVIPVVLPFAVVIGAAQALTAMNTDSELAVISASGASRAATMKPILLLGLLASLASFAVDNGAEPYARERGRELIAAARSDLLSLVLQEGAFRKIEDGLFIQVSQRFADGRLGGIFVADSRQEGVDLVYYARSGGVVQQDGKHLLVMDEGQIQRKLPDGEVSVIRFDSYGFDLSAFSAAAGTPTMLPKDRTLAYLVNPDPNDPAFKSRPQSFRAELHRRLTEWAYPLVFALIALAVAGDARSHREARVHPLTTTIVLCLVVRWFGFFAANQTQSMAALWPLVYLGPLGAAAVSCWFIFANRSMELPVSLAERLTGLFRRIGERMMFLRWRRARADETLGGSA